MIKYAIGVVIIIVVVAGAFMVKRSGTPSPSPTISRFNSPTPSTTPLPTVSAKPSTTPKVSATPTQQSTFTPTPTATSLPSSPTPTPTAIPTPTPSSTPTATPTPRPEPTISSVTNYTGTSNGIKVNEQMWIYGSNFLTPGVQTIGLDGTTCYWTPANATNIPNNTSILTKMPCNLPVGTTWAVYVISPDGTKSTLPNAITIIQ